MPNDDWYRRETWTPEFEREFEDRLSRARGQRGEYLRVQAWTLAHSGDRSSARAAIGLANRYLEENASSMFVAQMHQSIASALTILGDVEGATEAYRSAVEADRRTPKARQLAYLDYAWFAATHGLKGLYDEVLKDVEGDFLPQDLLFPANQYRYFGALAMITSDLGDSGRAKDLARRALAAAAAEHSGLSRHPKVGLVRDGKDRFRRRLTALAG